MTNEGWVKRDSMERLCPVVPELHIGLLQCHGERQGLLVFSGSVDGLVTEMALCLSREGELFALAWRVAVLGFQATFQRATDGFLGGLRRKSSTRRTQQALYRLSEFEGIPCDGPTKHAKE